MKKLQILQIAFFAFLLFLPHSVVASEIPFSQWLASFAHTAKEAGINSSTWQKAFAGVTRPDLQVLKKAAFQPEFKNKIWDYLDSRANILKAEEGRKQQRIHRQILQKIAARFGVEQEILLAIWSMESNYGAALNQKSRLHYIPLALATLAWGDKKRGKFARTQLIAALKILQAKEIAGNDFTGSWAGAMGHTQFIPTSYLAYGVDMDGDGRRNIWGSVTDALATAANLLARNHWRTGIKWGYEVLLPDKTAKTLAMEGETHTLRKWQQYGFLRPQKKTFASPGQKAVLKLPAGKDGPAFLVMRNFYILKRYNNADAYALAVGLLADRIAGGSGLVTPWPRPKGALSFKEKMELQRLLQQQGFYSGVIDGALGAASREAIAKWQQHQQKAQAHAKKQDTTPTRKLLEKIRSTQ